LTANAPENKDNDFTWRDFQARNDNELVAIYGNFINRIVVLTHKYYDGVVPIPNTKTHVDEETLAELHALPTQIATALESYRFREASQLLLKIARLGNKYLADEEPWKQQKTDPERVKTIMYNGLQIAAVLAIASTPFLPQTADKLKQILGLPRESKWDDLAQTEFVSAGTVLAPSELLFSKVEDDDIQVQLDKLKTQSI
jgi:methionyl-tRNA synthetase